MMTKPLKNAAKWIVGLCLCWTANAEMPLNPATARQVQELEKIGTLIAQKIELEEPQWTVVEETVESKDDLTLGIATLLLHRINTERAQELLAKISQTEIKPGSLTESVLKTERLAAELAKVPLKARVEPWVKAASDPNPYTQITAAKVLCEINPKAAKTALIKIEKEAPMLNTVANRLRRDLASQLGEEPPPPIPGTDPTYRWYEQSTKALPITLNEPLGPPKPTPTPQLPFPKIGREAAASTEEVEVVFTTKESIQHMWATGGFRPNTFYWTTEGKTEGEPKQVTEENKTCLQIKYPTKPKKNISVIRAFAVPPNATKATITVTGKTKFDFWANAPNPTPKSDKFGIYCTFLNKGKISRRETPILTDEESPTWKSVTKLMIIPPSTEHIIISIHAGNAGEIFLAGTAVSFE